MRAPSPRPAGCSEEEDRATAPGLEQPRRESDGLVAERQAQARQPVSHAET